MSLSASAIEAEYQRLNHNLGWRFLTCPERNICTATVALVTINPGGNSFQPGKWSVEEGSAYAIERWKGCAPGQEKLQKQVLRMFALMGVSAESVLSGYLVPYRSQKWQALPRKRESLRFSIELWREVFNRANTQTVVAFGKDTTPHIASLLRAEFDKAYKAAWGTQTIDKYRFGSSGKLLVLPHLSRFSLFNRPESEAAFLSAICD